MRLGAPWRGFLVLWGAAGPSAVLGASQREVARRTREVRPNQVALFGCYHEFSGLCYQISP
jgi:hypothetical protein